MNEFTERYQELEAKVGPGKLDRLILLERAANQRHWGGKIDKAVKYGMQFKDTTEIAKAVHQITEEMEKQSLYYEKGGLQ